MLLSLLKRRREEKAVRLLGEAKAALQRQSVLIEDMHDAVAAFHADVMHRPGVENPVSQRGDLSESLDYLEETARDAWMPDRVFDELTLSHCGDVRRALLTKTELERDIPPILKPGDSGQIEAHVTRKRETRVDKHLIRRIRWVNERAELAIQGMQRLNGSYRKTTRMDK